MSHLDTAYKIGAAAAHADFQRMIQEKQSQFAPGGAVPPASSTVGVGSPAEAVRGSAASGAATSTRAAQRGAQVPVGAPAPTALPITPPAPVR